jgi:nucleotide-binding universal stress UspA family protein
VDASGHAQNAARTAIAEAALRQTPLTVLHAWQSPRLDYNLLDQETLRELRHRARVNLAEAVSGLRADYPDVEVRLEIVDTPVVAALLDASRSADLLVVGRHGTGHVGSLSLGGVARRCISAAECPVIVTPSSRQPLRGPWLPREVSLGTGLTD